MSNLSIDTKKTKELGGGSLDNPTLYLQSHVGSSSYWTTPFVIASPSHGVCSYGEEKSIEQVSSENLSEVVSNFLSEEMLSLEAELGVFAIFTDVEEMSPRSSEALVFSLADEGIAQLLTNGNPHAGRLVSEVLFVLEENVLNISHTTFYTNILDCHEEIYGAS